jgi:porin
MREPPQLRESGWAFEVGQFIAAQEFFVSEYANLFVNSTFGWPAIDAQDLSARVITIPKPVSRLIQRSCVSGFVSASSRHQGFTEEGNAAPQPRKASRLERLQRGVARPRAEDRK